MSGKPIHVIGIDTSLRSTGVAIVSRTGSSLTACDFGAIVSPRGARHSECLRRLYEGIGALLDKWAPEAAAIEGAFYYKNARTALILGEARGSVIAACASRGVAVYEYAPRRVKQAVVGVGGAGKDQVRRMMMAMLGLRNAPCEDAADALAVAVCHLHNRAGHRALLLPEPI